MKMHKFVGVAIAALTLVAGAAQAAVYRFTATSAASGVLGYLDFDSSVFNGSSFQFINNTNLLDLQFTNPINSIVVTTVGPPGDSTIFDSTGALPTVVGGAGFTGGTDFSNGVWIAGTNFITLAGNDFGDVSWSTGVAGGVPEPATWALMIGGFGLAGVSLRRRKAVAA